MKIKRSANAVILLAALVLTACSLPPSTPSGNGASKRTLEQPEFKLNPNPKRAYTITVEVVDPPGEFNYVQATILYKVSNEECSAVPTGGNYVNTLAHRIRYDLKKEDDGKYKTVIYLDRMLDEDYYGKGVCIWTMESVGTVFKQTGAKSDSSFTPYLWLNDVIREADTTYYFWKDWYPNVEGFSRGAPATAKLTREEFAKDIKSEDIFEIKVTSQKGDK